MVNWQDISSEFTEELVKDWESKGFGYEEVRGWANALGSVFNPRDYDFISWLKNSKDRNSEEVLNHENTEKLRQEHQESLRECVLISSDKEPKKCEKCSNSSNWCQVCNALRFKQKFNNWTSGRLEIDQLIQKHQLEATSAREVLEWIPYEKFTDIEYLAEGGFGKVYKAKWIDGRIESWDTANNNWKRCKGNEFDFRDRIIVLKSLNNSSNMTKDFLQEITYHKFLSIKSISIVNCYGISQDPQTKNYILVTDYAKKGSLRKYLDNNCQYLDLEGKIIKLWSIAKGLDSIHQQGLIHKDLHPGNILIVSAGITNCYITDLGLCRPANETNQKKVYGNLPYVAPEVLRNKGYTPASDVYSFGIIAYEVLSGLFPYCHMSCDEFLAIKICQGLRPNLSDVPIPQLLKELIEQCWNDDSSKRPTANELDKKIDIWKNDVLTYQMPKLVKQQWKIPVTEFSRQYEEIMEANVFAWWEYVIKSRGHSQSTSCLLEFKNLPGSQNSEEINEQFYELKESGDLDSLRIDFAQLNLENKVNWQNIHPSFTEELRQKWQNLEFTAEQVRDWINIASPNQQIQAIQEPEFYAWLRDKDYTPEQLLNNNDIDINILKVEFEQSQQTAQILQTNLPNLQNK